jgi:tRNA 2-thiouridine synthesizing protein A
MADVTLDCKGLMCPLPIVKSSRASKGMTSGQTLEVLSTDKAFEPDIQAWCKHTGNTLTSFSEADGVFSAVITIK